jgi:hypothetical protein
MRMLYIDVQRFVLKLNNQKTFFLLIKIKTNNFEPPN